jgi:DDE superfamily endonuclease
MMTIYDKLRRRPMAFRSLTGLRVDEFDALANELVDKIDSYDESRLNHRDRERRIGAGGQYQHDARNRLLMAMIWLRIYPTYEVLGFVFDLHKSNIGRNLEVVLAVLREGLGNEIQWPDKTQRQRKMDDFMRDFPEVVAIVDATEQPILRPQDDETQKKHYSGKKRRHTLKTQVVVAPDGELMHVSPTVPGAQHDKKLYDESGVGGYLDEDEAMMGDSGFQGIQHQHPAILPHKKPKAGELTDDQKKYNRRVSRVRVVVENTIAQIKTFRVMAEIYRHDREGYHDLFQIVAVLVNRRIRRRPLRHVSPNKTA